MTRQKTFFYVFFFLFTLCVQAQNDLKRLKITKEISMLVPESFVPMSQSDIISKYVSARQPLAMFTSADRRVDLGINQNSSMWKESDLSILKDFYKAGILNLFTEVKFMKDEIREISGRKFVVFEFVSRVVDEENSISGLGTAVSNYTYIMYTLYEDRVLLFNFNCPQSERVKWQLAAGQMMESVRIK